MTKFDDWATAFEARDMFNQLIEEQVDKIRPRYRDVTVVEIDRDNRLCTVQYPEGGDPVPVAMGSIQPSAIGQVVRVVGLPGDRYIEDVFGPVYVDSISPWIDATLLNSWTNDTAPAQYRRNGWRLEFSGVVKRASAPTYPSNLFQITEPELIPGHYKNTPTACSGGVNTLYIGTDGYVGLWGAVAGNPHLDTWLDGVSLPLN